MHPAFHQELARSRQADLLREAELAHLAAKARAANPKPGRLDWLMGIAASLPKRPRLRRPVLGIAR